MKWQKMSIKLLWIAIFICLPVLILASLLLWGFLPLFFTAYIFTIIGLIVYYISYKDGKKLFNQWVLPLLFLPTPIPIIIHELNSPPTWFSSLQHIGTIIFALIYALPFFAVSLTIAVVITANERTKHTSII